MRSSFFLACAAAALCMAILGGRAFAADPTAFSRRVSVQIVTANDDLKSQVSDHIKRQIGKLENITVDDQTPETQIAIIVIVPTLQSGTSVGYLASVLVADRVDPKLLGNPTAAAGKPLSEKDLQRIVIPRQHFVQIAASNELEKLCEQIVKAIDAEMFAPLRAKEKDAPMSFTR